MIDQWLQWSMIPWLDAVVQVVAGMPLVDSKVALKLQMEMSQLALDCIWLTGDNFGVCCSDWRSSYKWPKQIRPSPEAWRLWRHTLTTLFCKSPKSTKLHQSLGAWQSAGPIHQQWTYFINPVTNCLLQCSEASGIYRSFRPAHSSRLFHSTADVTFSCPPRLLPVTVARQTQHYIEITAGKQKSRTSFKNMHCTSILN